MELDLKVELELDLELELELKLELELELDLELETQEIYYGPLIARARHSWRAVPVRWPITLSHGPNIYSAWPGTPRGRHPRRH